MFLIKPKRLLESTGEDAKECQHGENARICEGIHQK